MQLAYLPYHTLDHVLIVKIYYFFLKHGDFGNDVIHE